VIFLRKLFKFPLIKRFLIFLILDPEYNQTLFYSSTIIISARTFKYLIFNVKYNNYSNQIYYKIIEKV
jgi:hypothetical protein